MIGNIFAKTTSWAWTPDADQIGAPEGSLLRSDNLVPDELGAVSLRRGSGPLYTNLGTRVHSLRTAVIGASAGNPGTKFQFAGVDNSLTFNGTNFGVTFDGMGDIAMGDDTFQMFAARGTTKKKFDGTTLNQWGIAAPTLAPTLTAEPTIFTTIASFAQGESPAFVINEGTAVNVSGYNLVANAATQLSPAATGRASMSKVFASDQDFFNIAGSTGADTDLFDMYVYIQEPSKVDTVTIMFGLGTGADAYQTDYYYFDFKLPGSPTFDTVSLKDSGSAAATAYASATSKITTQTINPKDITKIITASEAKAVLQSLGRFTGPRSRERKDISEASPAWTHFSVTRGQFSRIGSSTGRNWTTIRAFKVVYKAVPGSNEVAAFQSAIMVGGGARSLTGTYSCAYRFARDTGNYIELSPISPLSTPLLLGQQGLRVTIPGAAIQGADPQVNQIWIYLYGGFLPTYYRVAVTGTNVSFSSMRIDEFAKTAHGTIDASDRTRLVNQGLSIPGFNPPTSDLALDVLKSEIDAILENETLEPSAIGPPDNIIAIAGPYLGRMYVLTKDGWVYPSTPDSPSNFSTFWALDLRRWGQPLWMVRTSSGIAVGMTKDIVMISGTGDVLSPDQTAVDLFPQAIGVGNPPVDNGVFTDQNSIFYRGSDDLMTLTGVTVTPASLGKVSLLWRGQSRHGVNPVNATTGRFRIAVSFHIVFAIIPEGSSTDGSTVIWRYAPGPAAAQGPFAQAAYGGQWSRTIYPVTFLSINRDPDGTVIAGTNNGQIWQLEMGATSVNQDNNTNIPINVLSAFSDGGDPLSRKDPFDLQLHAESDGSAGTINIFLDGAFSPALTVPFSFVGANIFRINLEKAGLPSFIRAQLQITGSFGIFRLRGFGLSYRARPQMVMAVDTGYLLPDEPKEMVWLREVEIDAFSPVDLQVVPYLDDVASTPLPVKVTAPNRRSVYRISFKKGLKARRPRLLVRTTNANGAGNIGFEPYMIRAKFKHTGESIPETPWRTVWPIKQVS